MKFRMRGVATLAWSAALLVTAGAGTATPATAAIFGSSSLATWRDCSTTAADAACIGGGVGQNVVRRQYGGGVGQGGTNDFTVTSEVDGHIIGFARSTVTFGDFDLPEVRTETYADATSRFNINTLAFQSYVFTGEDDTPFSLTATLHIVDSSSNLGDPSNGENPLARGGLPGGAIYSSYLGIWDPSVLKDFTTAEELNANLFYASCDTAGVLGTVGGHGALPGGEASFTTTTNECSAGSLLLKHGQEVLVVAGLQLPVNRGGFVDSTHSYTTRFGDNLSDVQKQVLGDGLQSAQAAVPEPASWALLITGFGGIGGVMRRRRAGARLAA